MREQYRDHPWFDYCAEFCAEYDQTSFDPDYPTEPLEHFEPLIRSVLAAPKSLYLAVEPWVEYVFDLAAYVVGFVPYLGVLAPQITFVYDLVESIVRSFLCVYGCEYNFIDFLNGTVSFVGALRIVGTDIADAFITFIHTEINWLLSFLPPLPPLPPLPDVAAAAADKAPIEMATALQEPVGGLLDAHSALTPAGLVEPLTAAPTVAAASDGVAALNPVSALHPGALLDPGPISDLGAVFDAGALSGALSDVSALSGLGLDLGGGLLTSCPNPGSRLETVGT